MKIIVVVVLVLTCLSGIASAQQYTLVPAYPNLSPFSKPLAMAYPNDGSNRMFIAEQTGKIVTITQSDTVSQKRLFLDLSSDVAFNGPECGLLGVAFHPDFSNNHYCYISATEHGTDSTLIFTVKRYTADPLHPDTVVAGSELEIFSAPLPESSHHGGTIMFGPDKYLYVAIGDGTGNKIDSSTGFTVGDWYRTAQNTKSYLGKVLRIDVDHSSEGHQYAIPADNPFIDSSSHVFPEVYAIGFRNPWKYSFDHDRGTLWLGDVGNLLYEEVDTIAKGANYGWSVMEGFHRYNDWNIDTSAMTLPIIEYPHFSRNGSNSITGGYVYRGKGFKDFYGKYIYGDFVSGSIWALDFDGLSTPVSYNLLDTPAAPKLLISSFAEDQNQELYVVSYYDGVIYKFTYPLAVKPSLIPKSVLQIDRTIISAASPAAQAYFSTSVAGALELTIIDETGREIRTIVNHDFPAGEYRCPVDLRGLSNGLYLIRMQAPGVVRTAKIIVQ